TVVTEDGRNLTGLIVEDSPQQIMMRMTGGGEVAVPRNNVQYTRVSKLSMMPEGIETVFDKQQLSDLFAFLSLDKPPSDPTAKPIPGARSINAAARTKLERHDAPLVVRARLPGKHDWNEIATFVMAPKLRPSLHPLRDATGGIILTEDKPADHPWQHGIFT